MENIVLVGFGGHARSVADCIERTGKYNIIGYTDMKMSENGNGYSYLGTDEVLNEIFKSGTKSAVVSIGQIGTDSIRHELYYKLKEIGFKLPTIIDPSAIIAHTAIIEEGTFVGKNTVVNSNSTVGKMSIINTGVIIEHDNKVGEFSHIAVRAVCCGEVTVGQNCFIGANATVANGISIGDETTIGAGSIVLHSVGDNEKKYGVI